MRKDEDDWIPAFERGIGIGSAPGFDEKAEPFQYQYVEINGRVNDVCLSWLFGSSCYDRSPDIEPISIRLAKPPKERS